MQAPHIKSFRLKLNSDRCAEEASEFEIAEFLRLSVSGKKIIVDTNISIENLHKISDYDHVAIMLCPQNMSAEHFFQRSDEEKQFIPRQIRAAENPEKTMASCKECLARTNSNEVYEKFKNSGFFTLYRENSDADTRDELLSALESHFRLKSFRDD